MELKIMVATELDGRPHKGTVVTVHLHPEGLASAEEMVAKVMNFVTANIHKIEHVEDHRITAEMIERPEKPDEITFRIETTINLIENGV